MGWACFSVHLWPLNGLLGSGCLLAPSIALPICIRAFASRVNKFKYAILKQRSSAKLHQESLSMFYSVELENQSLENQIKDENSYPSFRLLALFKPIRAIRGTERPHVLHAHITDQLKLSKVKYWLGPITNFNYKSDIECTAKIIRESYA